MRSRALFATALLAALPVVCAFAADSEKTPDRATETAAPPPITDVTEPRAVPENLQAARQPDEPLLGDIKILPSF